MVADKKIPRLLSELLPVNNSKQLILITGARQTGKTTLAKMHYPNLNYINLDALENRQFINRVSTFEWAKEIGPAILDEVQKEPNTFEKLKYTFDAGELSFSILLGSSQILLLKKIRESLAGRVALFELFPLMMSELANSTSKQIPMIDQLTVGTNLEELLNILTPEILPEKTLIKKQAQKHLMTWGGMPILLQLPVSERQKWIRDYEMTYLERDLTDLARINDLEPFRLFQKLAALRTGGLLNYSELARDAAVSVDTARRYLEYLKLSYQVELIQPYYRNITSSMVKTPKIYWLDLGIYRSLTQDYVEMSGPIYETLVISEIIKWKRTLQKDIELYFYRTQAGREVDLFIKTSKGIIGIEIKSRQQVFKQDAQAMKLVSQELKDQWLGGIIVYNGERIQKIMDPSIWAIPSWRLFT